MSLLERLGLVRRHKADLVILDNIFPHLLSAFRVAEFSSYLSTYKKAAAYSTTLAFPAISETRSFEEVREEYARLYPELAERTFRFNARTLPKGELIYFVFLQNAAYFIDLLERTTTPFVFTLYPGGGLKLNHPPTDEMLRRVFSLPNFGKVITTQKITQEYLLGGDFLDAAKTEFIYGGVLPTDRLAKSVILRKHYGEDKSTFDVCFVAYKYMPGGIDKGYDVFVEVARELSKLHADIFFHVVGTFDETDIDVADISERIKFYGPRPTEFFPRFYSTMDLILSPGVPFVLAPGAFDGFPTGSCIEAGLCGVALFCTDLLNQNVTFKPGEELVIIPRDVHGICHLIDSYYNDYEGLLRLARRGQEALWAAFAIESQVKRRLEILSEYLPPPEPQSPV